MEVETSTDPFTPVVLEEPTDDNETRISEEQPNKRRRKKSIVWEHFTIESAGPNCMRACCKQCKKSFAYITGTKLAGTSHLKRHISLGICPVGRQKIEGTQHASDTKTDPPPKRRYRTTTGYASIPFDQERCTHDIAKMIIQHDYPLNIVEHPAFIDFVRTLHPQYNMVSFNTIQGECVASYLREKQSLLEHINESPGRVNLTLDLAISNLSIGYAFLTGHFIDNNWHLQQRILNVIMLPFPDSEYAFNQAVVLCMSDWHLESKLFTITLDRSYSNENIIGNLRGLLPVKNSLLLNGQLLKGNCYARVLSRLAQDAMGKVQEPIRRIRESVKYVKTSETHDEKFAELRQQLQVPSSKELIIDDQTKWNTTYQMLVATCELKEVFGCLDTADPVYKINPSVDDWKQVEILCTYLKLFFDAANILTAPTYPPANAFYHEVSKIQFELSHAAMSQDPFVSSLTKPLKEKFDQYWKECFLVLAIAVVMDPRFKMKLVEFSFSKIFGEDAGSWIKVVDDGIHELFLDYLTPPPLATLLLQENVHTTQSDVPQEVVLVPPLGGPSQEFSSLEDYSPELPPQELQPEEKKPPEPHPQDVFQQEVDHQEAYPQECPAEASLLNVHTRDLPEEMHTQEVPGQEMQVHNESFDGNQPQEVPVEQMAQEMQAQDDSFQGNKPQEHSAEASLLNVHTQDLPQEMHAQEVPDQEMRVHNESFNGNKPQEVPVEQMAQEMQGQDDSFQGNRPQEVPVEEMGQEIQAQDKPSKENKPQEVPVEEVAQEMQAQDESSKENKPQEVPVEEMAQEIQGQDESSKENKPQEVPVEEMAQELQGHDESSKENKPLEVPLEEIDKALPSQEHTQEALSQEMIEPKEPMHAKEVLPEEMHPQELPSSQSHEEPPPQDTHMQEVPPPQEINTEEASSQEVHMQEAPLAQEMNSDKALTQEVHMQEAPPVQEMNNEEMLTQEVHMQEAPPVQEMNNEEMLTQEVHMQEAPPVQGINSDEVLTQEVPMVEVPPAQEMNTEAATQEWVPQEAPAQELLPKEEPHQEMLPQEAETQEIANSEIMSHHQVLPLEVHHPEANPQDLHLLSVGDGLSDFDVYISEIASCQHMKSELDQYLDESLLPRVQEFDVLGWWKLNKLKYPTLSKLAADILSIPFSTVPPDSVFDTVSKKIDSYQGSLHPLTLEAVICAKDWLQYGSSLSSSQPEASNAVMRLEF